ncbi:MAG: tRNA (adenosine(37)-N6)-threonylcarbamoyltransferase complex transferase subunit TsaD [Vicingaceae bacterium]
MKNNICILGIESSCDDTSAAVLEDRKILSNLIANQSVHADYGGVVPELASRAHQQNIVPVVHQALRKADKTLAEIDAIAYTRGPGLLGSLLVGGSFAKGMALGLKKPLIEVHHMKAHILAHFIADNESTPTFPFLCLTVSGGHTQIVKVKSAQEMEVMGTTIDDAAGEAFDKAAKMMGLPYPGGPLIDRYAKEGDPNRFFFKVGEMKGYDFSFSGLKTGILYFLQKEVKKDEDFIQKNRNDLCASIQKCILDALFLKLEKASQDLGISEIAIAGGVSANSALRKRLVEKGNKRWNVHIPKFEYCTDNAAMIAIAGHFLYQEGEFSSIEKASKARLNF